MSQQERLRAIRASNSSNRNIGVLPLFALKLRVPWRISRLLQLLWSRDDVILYRFGAHEASSLGVSTTSDGATRILTVRLAEMANQLPRPIPEPLWRRVSEFRTDALLHVALLDSRVAAWGISEFPVEKWPITEVGSWVFLPSASACLMSFETLPEYRRRGLYQALIEHILAQRLGEGAEWVYIWCLASNLASKSVIERIGFTALEKHSRLYFAGISHRRVAAESGALQSSPFD